MLRFSVSDMRTLDGMIAVPRRLIKQVIRLASRGTMPYRLRAPGKPFPASRRRPPLKRLFFLSV